MSVAVCPAQIEVELMVTVGAGFTVTVPFAVPGEGQPAME